MEFDIEVKVHDYEIEFLGIRRYTIKGTAYGASRSIAFNSWVAKAVPACADVVNVIKFEKK